VLNIASEYDGQYLTIEAQPVSGRPTNPGDDEGLAQLKDLVEGFVTKLQTKKAAWRDRLARYAQAGRKVVLWGSGSKAVAFLSILDAEKQIACVVDINPHRQGFFMPGSGLEIVSPQSLTDYRPDVVIIMNAIYRDEIGADLMKLDLSPEILTV
jgi:hypothetical protein